MYMAGALSSSVPFAVGDLGSEQGGRRDSHTEHISVDITEVEVSCSGPELQLAQRQQSKHLQYRAYK